jgi:hypothetical protein
MNDYAPRTYLTWIHVVLCRTQFVVLSGYNVHNRLADNAGCSYANFIVSLTCNTELILPRR